MASRCLMNFEIILYCVYAVYLETSFGFGCDDQYGRRGRDVDVGGLP